MSETTGAWDSIRIEMTRGDTTYVMEMTEAEGSVEIENESRELTPEETDFAPYRVEEPTGRSSVRMNVMGKLSARRTPTP